MKTRDYVIATLLLFGCDSPKTPEVESAVKVDPAQEATLEVSRMYELIASYYKTEHADSGEMAFIGEGGKVQGLAPHRCSHPKDQPAGGDSGAVPPLTVTCSAGPDGKCVPTDNPSKPYEYDKAVWQDNAMFSALGFSQDKPHRFHYGIRTINEITGYGRCQFTAQAFGDLDGDSVFSTYERAGGADQSGVNSGTEFFIDKAGE